MFTPFFRKAPVRNLDDAKACDQQAPARLFVRIIAMRFDSYLQSEQCKGCYSQTVYGSKGYFLI
jgi:hypothetical protein